MLTPVWEFECFYLLVHSIFSLLSDISSLFKDLLTILFYNTCTQDIHQECCKIIPQFYFLFNFLEEQMMGFPILFVLSPYFCFRGQIIQSSYFFALIYFCLDLESIKL